MKGNQTVGLLADIEIKKLVEFEKMIDPFISFKEQNGMSYGLCSYGYDIRWSGALKTFQGDMIDPKEPQMDFFKVDKFYRLAPQETILGLSVETFKMPSDVLGICLGKSSYARCGILINTTPLEPGWRGRLVVEITNLNCLPVKLYVNEGIAQILFFRGDSYCSVLYQGQYQDQFVGKNNV